MSEFWLSFVLDGKCAGACIVSGGTLIDAVREAWALRINPGGEVAAFELGEKALAGMTKYPRNKLMTVAEIKALGGVQLKELDR